MNHAAAANETQNTGTDELRDVLYTSLHDEMEGQGSDNDATINNWEVSCSEGSHSSSPMSKDVCCYPTCIHEVFDSPLYSHRRTAYC